MGACDHCIVVIDLYLGDHFVAGDKPDSQMFIYSSFDYVLNS